MGEGSVAERDGVFAAGTVAIVGAGPGDPGLITVRGLRRIECAEALVYDHLASPLLVDRAPPSARRHYVGKWGGRRAMSQEEINALLVELARDGLRVVRLKGGDPFLYGRGGEEADALARAGIPFEVVPGITSALAVPAYAGIPVTDRRHASTFAVATGHEAPDKPDSRVHWDRLAGATDTLAVLMGTRKLSSIAQALVRAGRPADTPAAVVAWGTTARQRVVVAPLREVAERTAAAGIAPPTVLVVGDVVRLRDELAWVERKPLFGLRVVVTRAREQAMDMAETLVEKGAEVSLAPAIAFEPPEDPSELDAALDRVETYDAVIFTSVNGVEFTVRRLLERGRDARAFARCQLVAIGPVTASALGRFGLHADAVAGEFRAEGVLELLRARGLVEGRRLLLPRAERARALLPRAVREAGGHIDVVTAYRTVRPEDTAARMARALARGADVVTVTSSSTVRHVVEALGGAALAGEALDHVAIASIGPITSATVFELLGRKPEVEAEVYTAAGLVSALERWWSERRGRGRVRQ